MLENGELRLRLERLINFQDFLETQDKDCRIGCA